MFIFIKYIVWFLEFGLFIPSINISTRFFTYSSYNKFISDYEYYSCRLILAITTILVWEIKLLIITLPNSQALDVHSVVKDLKDMVLVYGKEIKIN
jgi:hypothetical protein